MENLQYSIIYGVIRPEISEQVSLGILIVSADGVRVRFSQKKLSALRPLYSDNEYVFVGKFLRSLAKGEKNITTDNIDYLSRYSNNLIALSQLQTIDLKPSKSSEDWLYKNYVYSGKN